MNIYDTIANLCKTRSITIDYLMQQIGKTGDVYYGWRARDVYPRADVLCQISQVLDVPMEYFFPENSNYVIPVSLKPLAEKLVSLPAEDVAVLNNLSKDQLQKLIDFCKSIQN